MTAAAAFDCIIVGAGHNGLVCANYLARAGRRVLVVEAAATVGGAAVTDEFVPGFRVSAAAHLLHALPKSLVEDLGLRSHGLQFAAEELTTVALSPDGASLPLTAQGITAHAGAAEAAAYAVLMARLSRFAGALAPLLEDALPRLGTQSRSDHWTLLRLGWQIRRLGRSDMRELLRIAGMCVHDLLQEHFNSPLLQGALAHDAVLGTNFGPRAPGTVFTWLHRLACAAHAGRNAPAMPLGGMGAVPEALAAAARASGVTIRTGSPVRRIEVEADRVAGVLLDSGEKVAARLVVSGADPKTTFLGLLGAEHLDTGFVRRVSHLRCSGLTAKLHLALDRLPTFRGVDAGALGERLLLSPSAEYVERAFNPGKYGELPPAPIMEVTLPSVRDPRLAPSGSHVLSAVVQYVPYQLKEGWDQARNAFIGRLVECLEEYAPGLHRMVVGAELLAPPDLERRFRTCGGHWHHAELALDQFLMVRPVPGATQYATPVPGLYLCGAGSHPGGGVMGTAGRNAARRILAESPR